MNREIVTRSVKVSNDFINVSYALSLKEQRLFLATLSKIPKDTKVTDEQFYSCTTQDYAKLAKLKNKRDAYTELCAAAEAIVGNRFWLGHGKKHARTLVEAADFKSGQVDIRFSKSMVPYISDIRREFTLIHMHEIEGFKSIYSLRLFLNLMQWRNQGFVKLSLDQIRWAWKLGTSYKQFPQLKQRCIEPAMSEINQKTGWTVGAKYIKTGKPTTHVSFFFYEKTPEQKKLVRSSC